MRRFITAGAIALAAAAIGGGAAQAKDPVIIMVSGPLIEPFFGPLKKGADDAAKALGIDYQYSTIQDFNNVQADLTRLVQQAAARQPDVLVVSNFFPDSMGPQIKKASDAGIPVIIMDGGFAQWRDVGGLTYVGYDPHEVGVKAGLKPSQTQLLSGSIGEESVIEMNTTVESLASPDGTLNPLQLAFQQHHALQCGFCTPGILMSFTDYLARNPHPTEDEIRDVLSGHLCRCTGYAGIVAAVLAASGGSTKQPSVVPAKAGTQYGAGRAGVTGSPLSRG